MRTMDCSTILERKLGEIDESNEFYSFISSGSVHKNIYLHTRTRGLNPSQQVKFIALERLKVPCGCFKTRMVIRI